MHSMLLKLMVCTMIILANNAFADKYFAPEGIAIRGYDTVSYFTNNKAEKGMAKYAHQWQDVTWYFTNAKHLAMFKAAPQQYAPQFGGFCALGAAHLGAVPTDPETFTLYHGKLYLNMAPPVGVTWRLNPDFHIQRASKAWQEGGITFY